MKDLSNIGKGNIFNTEITINVSGNATRETADDISRAVDRAVDDAMKRLVR